MLPCRAPASHAGLTGSPFRHRAGSPYPAPRQRVPKQRARPEQGDSTMPAIASFRPRCLSGLGGPRRSAGVPERSFYRGLETLLLSYGLPYMRRRCCLPRGALGCDRFIRAPRAGDPGLSRGRKRAPPGIAMAVRATEKFAVLGVDSVGIAHKEPLARTPTCRRGSATSCLWYLGRRRDASNGLGAHLRVGNCVL
jgi:hypothetical protein